MEIFSFNDIFNRFDLFFWLYPPDSNDSRTINEISISIMNKHTMKTLINKIKINTIIKIFELMGNCTGIFQSC